MFILGALANLVLVMVDPGIYGSFADASFLPFVTRTWVSVVAPHATLFVSLLVVFELAVGISILRGGRWARFGLAAAIAFHAGLMFFGWGFWLWSVPMIAVLSLLLYDDLRTRVGARDLPLPYARGHPPVPAQGPSTRRRGTLAPGRPAGPGRTLEVLEAPSWNGGAP